MAIPTKQYGLILPQKKGLTKTSVLQKPSVFGDDSDEETTVGQSLLKEAAKKKMMKQTRLEMQKALEQDSTVYDYDAVYDEIQNQRQEKTQKVLQGTDKRPKYIHQLMKAVDDRKKEQERREERKIQKEREAEGEKFADKEAYVTSAYKKKLEEQKEELEREKREAALEAALDVKKQKDLSGFYRHFLNQTVGEEAIPDRSVNTSPVSQPSALPIAVESIKTEPSSKSQDGTNSSDSDGEEQKPGLSKPVVGSSHSRRQYRQRSPSSDSEPERERDRHRKNSSEKDGVKVDEQKPQGEEKEEPEERTSKFAKRSTDQTVSSARERYLARQMAR
uniref:Nuclear speckle splicing regulatory protein 1 n=1 Tax=Tetraodon nigroviridis TaxID=99883 RepID=H3DFF8_TETNG